MWRGPGPEQPHLNGTHPPPGDAEPYPRYAGNRSSSVIHAELARWVLSRQPNTEMDSDSQAVAAEGVFQKLAAGLSRLVSRSGAQALVARALRLSQVEFPFLAGVRAGTAPDACLAGLQEHVHDVEPGEAHRALLAVLGTVLNLLVGFIGEDLTFRMVQEIWLDVPIQQPGQPGNPDGQETNS